MVKVDKHIELLDPSRHLMNVNLMSSSVACNEKHMSKATNPMDIVVAPTSKLRWKSNIYIIPLT